MENLNKRVIEQNDINEIVINGDFTDEWMVPVDTSPNGGLSIDDYYRKWASDNKDVVDLINELAKKTKVVFIPGNHEMNITLQIFKSIFPNIEWHGMGTKDILADGGEAPAGMGMYSPDDDNIYIEHGHRYDMFNSPDPISNINVQDPHILPMGYYITRVEATNNRSEQKLRMFAPVNDSLTSIRDLPSREIAKLGWWHSIKGLGFSDKGDDPLVMDNWQGYPETTLAQARDIYAKNYSWPKLQDIYGSHAISAIQSMGMNIGYLWLGADMSGIAKKVYFDTNLAKIVVFGHTHLAALKKMGNNIYANSGSFVDDDYVPEYKGVTKRSGTYLTIDFDKNKKQSEATVKLWQYKPDDTSILVQQESTQL